MGFKKSASNITRYGIDDCYELTRFASSGVRGAFSKIIKHFKNITNVECIYSFADLEIVDKNDNVYIKNNFIISHYVDIDYKYLDRAKNRVHKFNYRKSKFKALGLDIENKTESQLAKEYGLRKCWDSGKICYIWNK